MRSEINTKLDPVTTNFEPLKNVFGQSFLFLFINVDLIRFYFFDIITDVGNGISIPSC